MSIFSRLRNDFRLGTEILRRERAALKAQGESVGGENPTVSISVSNRLDAPVTAVLGSVSGLLAVVITSAVAKSPADFVYFGVAAVALLAVGATSTRSVVNIGRNTPQCG